MENLSDAKIISISFCFNAENILLHQNMIIELQQSKPNEYLKYTLTFIDVSNFEINIKTGEIEVLPKNYKGDTMYISNVKRICKNDSHQVWKIKLIDNIGEILVACDNYELELSR